MKKSVLLAALVAVAMPTMAQQVKYSVSGTYSDNGKKIYLIDKLTDNAIDSMVVADGKFSFSGTAALPRRMLSWVFAQSKKGGRRYSSTTAHQW